MFVLMAVKHALAQGFVANARKHTISILLLMHAILVKLIVKHATIIIFAMSATCHITVTHSLTIQ